MSAALAIIAILLFFIILIVITIFLLLRFIGGLNPIDFILGSFKNIGGTIGNIGDTVLVNPAKDVGNKIGSVF